MPRSDDTVKTAGSSSAAAEEEAAQVRELFDVEVLPWAEVPAWHVGLWRKSKGRGRAGVVGGSAVRCAPGAEDPAVVATRSGPAHDAGNNSDDDDHAGGAEDVHHLWSPAAGVEGKGFAWDATRELRAKGTAMQLAVRPDGEAVAHPVSTHTYVGRRIAGRETAETEAETDEAYPLLWEAVSAVHPLRFACWSATRMPAVVRADNMVHFPLELRSGEGRSVPVAPLDVGRYAYCLAVWERSERDSRGGGGSGGAAFVVAVQFEDELRLYTMADEEGGAARFRLALSIPCGLWLARSSCFAEQGERERGERSSNETLPGLISPDALVFNDGGTLLLLCALDGCAVFGLQWGGGGGGGGGGEEASRVPLTAWPVCRGFFRNRVAGGVFASATRCLLFSRFPARLTLWDVFASEVVWATTVCTAPLHAIAYRPFRPAGGDAHEHQWPTARPLPSSNQPWMCGLCRNRQPSSARCAECVCGAKCCRVCVHVHVWGREGEGPGEAWRCGVCDGRMRVADRAHPCTKCRAWACEVCARGTPQEPEERPAAVFLAGSRGLFSVVLPQQPGGDGGRLGTARAMHPEWQHGAFAAHAVPAQGAVFRSRAAAAQRRRGGSGGGGAKRKAFDDAGGGGHSRRRRAPELHSMVESDSSSESAPRVRGGGGVAAQPLPQGFVPAPYQAPHAAPRVLGAARHEAPRLYPVVSIAGEALQTSLSATPMPTDPRKVTDLMQQLLSAARPVQGTWSGQQLRSSGRLRLIPPHGVKPFSLRGCTSTIRYARDGSLFLLFTRDTLGVGEVVVVSGQTGAVRFRLCIPHNEVSKLALICLSAAVMRLTTVDGTHVTCYDIVSNSVVWQSATPVPLGESNLTHMVLTPTGCVLVPELPLHTRVDIHTSIASDWGSDDCTAVATCSKLNHAWLPLASPANVVHFAKMEGLRDLFKRGLSLVPASTEFSDALVDVFLA